MEKDYDMIVKRRSRKKIRKFIQHNLVGDAKNKKVLFLPGVTAYDVFEIFDPLGFKRENLYGLECNPSLYPQVQKIAQQLKFNLLPRTTYADFATITTQVFDVMWLDFQGQFTQIGGTSPNILAKDGIVITNFLGARENGFSAETYAFMKNIYKDLNKEALVSVFVLSMFSENYPCNAVDFVTGMNKEEFDNSFHERISATSTNNVISEDTWECIEEDAVNMTRRYCQDLLKEFLKAADHNIPYEALAKFLWAAKVQPRRVMDHSAFKYNSNPSPMFIDMFSFAPIMINMHIPATIQTLEQALKDIVDHGTAALVSTICEALDWFIDRNVVPTIQARIDLGKEKEAERRILMDSIRVHLKAGDKMQAAKVLVEKNPTMSSNAIAKLTGTKKMAVAGLKAHRTRRLG
jgi:hypothetical protein